MQTLLSKFIETFAGELYLFILFSMIIKYGPLGFLIKNYSHALLIYDKIMKHGGDKYSIHAE